jgi:hypothetical protein
MNNASIREGRIILPMKDNSGNDISSTLLSLQERLTDEFGGVTIMPGVGLWKDAGTVQREDVANFLVAGENTIGNNALLRAIAAAHGELAGQKTVYVRAFDGDVRFIDTSLPDRIHEAA